MPLTWILVSLFVAFFTKREKRRRLALLTSIILLLFFTNPFIINEALLAWEERPKPMAPLPRYDAGILLTGFTNQDKSPHDRIYTNKGADRLLHTVALFKAGKLGVIIVSGGSGALLKKQNTEAEELKHMLLLAGIPENRILIEERSRNTYENAQYTKQLLQHYPGLQSKLLITSAFHMRRAAGCFSKAGFEFDTFSTDFYSHNRSFTPDKLIVPGVEALSKWHKLIHEITGFIMYKMMGYS